MFLILFVFFYQKIDEISFFTNFACIFDLCYPCFLDSYFLSKNITIRYKLITFHRK